MGGEVVAFCGHLGFFIVRGIGGAGFALFFCPFFADFVGHFMEGGGGFDTAEIDSVFGGDAQGGGGGDGVLVGGEEDEFPALGALFADEVGDVEFGVFVAGVFMAVSEDGDDDFAGFGFVRAGGEGAGHFGQGAADGIEEGGAASGEEGGGGEVRDFGQGDGLVEDFVLVIEEDEGEAGGIAAGFAALGGEEGVEAADGVVGDGLHGTGAVEDEGDFGEHREVGGGQWAVGSGQW